MNNNYLSRVVLISVLTFTTMISIPSLAAPLDEGEGFQGVERMQMRLRMLERYLQVVESVHSISDDPEKTAIFQLQQLEDMYKRQRDPEKVISLYREVLKNTSNLTVRNAVSMRLAQLLKRAGKESDAVELTRNSLNENLKQLK